jgi:ribosome production factor 2
MLPIREIKPKNARTKRYITTHRTPLAVENARSTLFLRYTTVSQILQLVVADIAALKKPLIQKFSKKNNIHPFEDASSFEFFSEKNDASLMVFSSHSKKRPHCLTIMRFFGSKVLDMLELMVQEDSMRTLEQFKNKKAAVGLKPLLSFSGSAFESPTSNSYTLAKSLFVELFKGEDVDKIDVEGLQYMMHFSVDEEESEEVKPIIHLRCYLIKTKKTLGSSLPRVDVEEMGPRIDFRVGRVREADPEMMREAMRRPRAQEVRSFSTKVVTLFMLMLCYLQPKTKKNIETDIIGDKVGRIHLGRQDLSTLQTRKMKGLKRSRDVDDDEGVFLGADDEVPDKRVRVEE